MSVIWSKVGGRDASSLFQIAAPLQKSVPNSQIIIGTAFDETGGAVLRSGNR